jgi:hypothetical protein
MGKARIKSGPRPPVAATPDAMVARVEADALKYAVRRIREFHLGGTPWGPESPLDEAGSRAYVRAYLKAGARISAVNRTRLVEAARVGEEDCDIVARELILEAKSQRQALPVELEAYNMKLVLGDAEQPPHQSGPLRKNKFARNMVICLVVSAVAGRFGLSPNGRENRRWRSASWIVAEALRIGAGICMGEKGVEKVWAVWGHATPRPGPEWADLLERGPLPA